ncbi:MAG TPA: hypothetical protein VGD81_10035 [Opitutaceae bacterium]
MAAGFTGCASFNRIAHYPNPQQSTTVSVAATPMAKMSELPIGAYYDEPRHIIVTGHQKGLLAGMAFGLVGVVVADQMNKSAGADKFGAAAAQGSDLGTMLNELVASAIAEANAQQWSSAAEAAGLQLTPYAVFTVEKTGEARLYAMLRAETPGKDGKPVWSGRYFARAAGSYPLQDGGWMSDGRFSSAMRVALERALRTCIDDTHGRLTGAKMVTAKGRYPFINTDFELRAIVVQEQPDYLVAKLAVGDVMVLAGTHVLDRADYEIKPAEFKDPRL